MTKFSKEALITLLDSLKSDILNDKITEEDQTEIWDYLTGTFDKHSDVLKYLFLGWLICNTPNVPAPTDIENSMDNFIWSIYPMQAL